LILFYSISFFFAHQHKFSSRCEYNQAPIEVGKSVKTFTKCKDICRTENQCRFYLYHFESQECFVYDSDKLSCNVTFDRFDTDVKRCHDATITTNSDSTPSQSFNDTVREVNLKTIQSFETNSTLSKINSISTLEIINASTPNDGIELQEINATTSGIRELEATTPGITESENNTTTGIKFQEISSTTTKGIYGLDTTTTTAYMDLNTTISEIPGIDTSTTTTTITTIAIPGIDTSTTTTGMPILDLSTTTITTTTGSYDITTPWDGSSSWKPQLNMSE
jgi:hypothetical protein